MWRCPVSAWCLGTALQQESRFGRLVGASSPGQRHSLGPSLDPKRDGLLGLKICFEPQISVAKGPLPVEHAARDL